MKIVLDGRPLQEGFREHRKRGIGRYAEALIPRLERLDPDLGIGILLNKRNTPPDAGVVPGRAEIVFHPVPGILCLYEEMIDTLLYVPRTLKQSGGRMFHFLTHMDAAPVPAGSISILTVHDMIPAVLKHRYASGWNPLYRAYLSLMNRAIRRADRIITISESSKQDIIRYAGIPESRIRVIPLGVDCSFKPVRDAGVLKAIQVRYKLPARFFFYTGGIETRKNVPGLIIAFQKMLKSAIKDCHLVIGGNVEDERGYPALLELVRSSRLEDRICFTGYIENADLPAVYSLAEAFVYPSLYEGFGFPPLEAMACGAPVICSDRSAIPEIVGEAGLLADPENPEQLAQLMAGIWGDAALRSRLMEAGLKRARLFDWDRTARATLDVYHEFGETA
ncbi:glycosyltransferase family 4 protein [bacterium]|nr:glycosyltransferase family 4 protein [bacterium]